MHVPQWNYLIINKNCNLLKLQDEHEQKILKSYADGRSKKNKTASDQLKFFNRKRKKKSRKVSHHHRKLARKKYRPFKFIRKKTPLRAQQLCIINDGGFSILRKKEEDEVLYHHASESLRTSAQQQSRTADNFFIYKK